MKNPKTLIKIEEPEIDGPELAERWRVDPATIRQYRREGMPGRKISYRKFLYQFSSCNAWLEGREAEKEKIRQERALKRAKTNLAEVPAR